MGEKEFGSHGFRYCGSLLAGGRRLFDRGDEVASVAIALAAAVTEEFGLVGLNGLDFVARGGVPYPIEVNPRYSASMELVERSTRSSLFQMHETVVRRCSARPDCCSAKRQRQGRRFRQTDRDDHRQPSVGGARDRRRASSRRTNPPRASDLHSVRRRTRHRRMPRAARARGWPSVSRGGDTRERCGVSSSHSTESVTCLGCGCGCDDLTVQVKNDRIVDVSPACPVAQAWFGDGSVPDAITRGGTPVSLDKAIAAAASTLGESAGRVLVYIGPELSSQAQRTALAIADLLRARVDTATSRPAAAGLLAAQRRGRAAATLAEIRNRADVVLFWAVDPRDRYPRFISRFVDATGTHVPLGRKGRRLIAVSVGADRGPPGADLEVAIAPSEEIDALSVMRATVLGNTLGALSATLETAAKAAKALSEAKYGVLVHEAEAAGESANPLRAEGLIALTQALNGPTRAALCSLRAGGNRSGAESVLTSQTGYPMAVDFSQGFPRYGPGNRALEAPAARRGGARRRLRSPN